MHYVALTLNWRCLVSDTTITCANFQSLQFSQISNVYVSLRKMLQQNQVHSETIISNTLTQTHLNFPMLSFY